MQRILLLIALMLHMVACTSAPASPTPAPTPEPTQPLVGVLTRENVSQITIQNEFMLGATLFTVTYSPDGQFITLGTFINDAGEVLFTINSTTGERVQTYTGHTDLVTDIAYSPDGTRIVSSSVDKTIRIWDAQTGEQVMLFDKHTDQVFSVEYHPSGKWIASCDFAGKVLVWDVNTGEIAHEQTFYRGDFTTDVTSLAFSPDGNFLAIGTIGIALNIWDWDSGLDPISLSQRGHQDGITSIAYGEYIVTGSLDKTVRIWDVFGVKHILEGHESRVTGVAISPNSQLVASVSWDDMLKVWDVETGSLIIEMMLVEETSLLSGVAFSRDGRFITVISGDGRVFVLGI